ncbi:MAG TPA: RluA family pseudouridine synthase [Hypericibacter adhaerens]|jgi:23S rRNA pseudouridine955/2504/2580 synthase|uniref:RluA family pseudouridine synthase n=1 Tax=Hypericibacter adhaerens TaxID=2602016 RepID=UPI002C361F90|nr:RluA family pseudouridine synthase [Hypericibacter adhaerens]HWA42271.1 RluA family pseudouridine synthase [Hypericibacter adhaerens]
MSGVESITVGPEEAEQRLDRWFKRRYPELGHGHLEKLLRTGQVRVDGKRVKSSHRLEPGQVVRVPPLATGDASPVERAGPRASRPNPALARLGEDLRRRVLHRDDWLIVLDKPAGLAVQGGTDTTLHLDAALDELRFGSEERPRLVHRLDKDTSGVLVLARTQRAAAKLASLFRGRDVHKLYWAAVVGLPQPLSGRIDLALSKRPGQSGERVRPDQEEGQRAITYYRTVEHAGRKASWLALRPETGRTHQLRAHCAALGTPILGDGKYGGADAFLPGKEVSRQLHLHARAIELPHPAGKTLRVAAPLPPHMVATWKFLGFSVSAGPASREEFEF